jgi:hypothetical protein
MGCCNSKDEPLNTRGSANLTVKDINTKKEDKVELAFRVKRANIFTEGVDDYGRETYIQKKIPKSEKQQKIICELKFRTVMPGLFVIIY